MKVRVTQPILVPGGAARPGEIVDLPEASAWNVVAIGRGEVFTEPAKAAVETSDPQPENRDPEPAKKRR